MNNYTKYVAINKVCFYFVLAATIFSACKKDDSHLFDKSPDQRLNEALAKYQSQLSGAQNGWKGTMYPKTGGAYTFYFKFNDSNRVKMLSGFDSSSAVTLKESSYRLKALQQPSLLFDTYSYLHVLADPNPAANGGIVGAGLISDFEFYFDAASADTINLLGRLNGSRLLLVKATPSEAAAFTNGQLANAFLLNKIQTYFKRISVSSQSIDLHINISARTVAAVDANGDLLDSSRITSYYASINGITFQRPLTIANQSILGLSNLSWNATTGTINCTVNNVATTISPVVVPMKVDVNAPRRWWNLKAAAGDYWSSDDGFHDNGVDNADRIDTLTARTFPYYYLIYWPKYDTGNDLFGPVFLNTSARSLTLIYGNAPAFPAYTTDGKAVFSLLGNYGTYPATGPAASTSARLFRKSGYYFVQTSAQTYDMVSALDGRSWITWE